MRRIGITLAMTVLAAGCLEPVEQLQGVADTVAPETSDTMGPTDASDGLAADIDDAQPPDSSGSPAVPPEEKAVVTDGLVAQWGFDHLVSGLIVPSVAGSCGIDCDALVRNGPDQPYRGVGKGSGLWTDASALGGKLLQLDGDDDSLRIPDNGQLLQGWTDFTIEVRLRLRPWSAGQENAILSSWGGAPGDEAAFAFEVDDDGRPLLKIGGTDGALYASDVVSRDSWHVVTVTFQGGGDVCFGIDGLVGSCAKTEAIAVPAVDLPYYIGGVAYGGTNARHHLLVGDLDLLRVYNRALSLIEVQKSAAALADDGKSSEPPAPCESFLSGCQDETLEVFADFPGIAGCAIDDPKGNWGPALDEGQPQERACADGYRVCTVADLVALTPNRALPIPKNNTLLLSQNGCMDSLFERWVHNKEFPDSGDGCGFQTNFCGTAGDGVGIAITDDPGGPDCTGLVHACGNRFCRAGHTANEPIGVACCSLQCLDGRGSP